MKIQYNTDKTVNGEKRNETHFTSLINDGLKRFESLITRIEVYLSDENGKKEGLNDMKCTLEARIEGRQPVVVSCQADKPELAVYGAIDKMKNSLDTVIGRMQRTHV
ncbi:MAG: HPF/RaiA family ribosome-associated protein [Bacteroidetes bacterium]|nr:HPF/RaiA family ribosome-associated protein [Bacteroidota bacterium]